MIRSFAGRRHGEPGLSVVVPAYNVGGYLDRCLDSLVNQSLDRARYDVIVVDDGSTDGTAERLDLAAKQHPDLIRVKHITNSGWPGRPRNIGTDLSTREYVFYCDADDWLLPDALEAMLDRAVHDNADVVMVRPVGSRRQMPQAVFDRGDRCTNWRETPGVFTSLTCQKLFRRDFLRERGLRFGEGRVRLEDFQFMVAAYLRAERVSIVGSRPCYVFERRTDGGHLTQTRATEDEYFASVEKILDIVLAETEPGPHQDMAFDRLIRAELVSHVSRPALFTKSPEDQVAVLSHVRRLLTTKVPPSAIARLDAGNREWIRRIERGDLDALKRRIRAQEEIAGSAVVGTVSWDDSVLTVDLAVALQRHGVALSLERRGESLLALRLDADDEPSDVTNQFAGSSVQVRVRLRRSSEEWRVPVALTNVAADGTDRLLAWSATMRLDVNTLAAGAQLPVGVWDLVAVITSCGIQRIVGLQAPEGTDEPAPAVLDGVRARPYWTKSGALAMSIRPVAPPPSRGTENQMPTTTSSPATPAKHTRRSRRMKKQAWRLALASARRMGLSVTKVGAGQVLVSRSTAPKVATLVKGRSWIVSKGDKAGGAFTADRLGDQHWVLGKPGAAAPHIDEVGSRGWLISRPDTGALADIHLENQTLQHLAARHVTWLLARYDVDLVLDVGANTGQYGQNLRRSGYRGRIASFEPVPHFADAVDKLAANDSQWSVYRIALGSSEGTVPIRVQRTFSSLLPASDYGKGRFGTLRDFADKDEHVVDVPLRRLETMLDDLVADVHRADGAPPRVFLKMDTQGFDLETFRGLGDRVSDIVGLQSEVALLLIYEGMPRMPEALATYESAGFEISGMYPVTTEPDGRVIEYDCVMVRASTAPTLR
ncbi:FkbM family methyltransferase [uncultured Jatrophihabitans sp.]|uniref:FkbM family methyltransferase n=1 Tax=uncultured Jatrophihabitans sp. TaxID=1610747 RepID=UPI0035CB3835